jgi:hypothetical protein
MPGSLHERDVTKKQDGGPDQMQRLVWRHAIVVSCAARRAKVCSFAVRCTAENKPSQ